MNQSKGGSPLHQTVAQKIEFESAGQSIQIEFTDQQLSPHAGTATFWSFVQESGWRELVARCLPHPEPTSNNALSPLTKVLGFVQGLLCGAKKLTHVAYLRRDPDAGPARNQAGAESVDLHAFLPGFHQRGQESRVLPAALRVGYAPIAEQGGGLCIGLGLDAPAARGRSSRRRRGRLHPRRHQALPASVARDLQRSAPGRRFWLRPGNCSCSNNVVGFFFDLWDNLPSHLRVRVVRADSGF